MSDLQIGLLGIGAFVVIAVIAYNKWQERRYRRNAANGLDARHGDVLMGETGTMQARGTQGAEERNSPSGERIEPTYKGSDVSHDRTQGPALAETLDFVVAIEVSEPVPGEKLIDAAVTALAGFSKTVQAEGFNVANARWEPLQHQQRYALMRAGLQLADRRGPVGAEDLTRFSAAVQEATTAIGALATIPDSAEGLNRAIELDRFCGDVDIQIALHVVSGSNSFPGAQVRAACEAAGLSLEEDGRFRKRDLLGRVLFDLCGMDRTSFRSDSIDSLSIAGLALELDVPRVPAPSKVFEQFRDLAQHLAGELEGQVVNENRAALSDAAFEQILNRIQSVQRAMEDRSVPPGSPAALRLFS